MYISICKTDEHYKAGHPKLVLWDNPEGQGGKGGGGGLHKWGAHIYVWLIHVDVWQKPSQYCKVIILQSIKLIN